MGPRIWNPQIRKVLISERFSLPFLNFRSVVEAPMSDMEASMLVKVTDVANFVDRRNYTVFSCMYLKWNTMIIL
jgi:hypothetical protein